jgi:two-component system chemotaxis sensor kinase CheA
MELLATYLVEAEELLAAIEEITLDLGPSSDPEQLNGLFRAFHTLKGSSATVGLTEIADFAHHVESALQRAREGTLPLSPTLIELILEAKDHIARGVVAAAHSEPLPTVDPGFPIRLDALLHGEGAAPVAAAPVGDPPLTLWDEDPAEIASIIAMAKAQPAKSAVVDKTDKADRGDKARSGDAAVVRVAADKLDRLVELIGELVIANARLGSVARDFHDPDLDSATEEIERLTGELRESVLGVRMTPIGTMYGRFRRLVRDLSIKLEKPIDLVTGGAETEIDKNILDLLVDPLMHVLRNAIDHGVESPAARADSGKNPVAVVTIRARHEGSHVVISVSDDGRGLDEDLLRKKAIEKGLIQPDAMLTRAEAFALIMLPGFSTAAAITDVSGRGVGMDVVRRQIESLRGTIVIHSERGRGTTFELRLPLTLAIIDGLLVEVAGARYIVPRNAVRETVEFPRNAHGAQNGRRTLVVRGELLPYVALGELFGEPPSLVAVQHAVIVGEGDERNAIIVDRVIGELQTVVQPMCAVFRSVDVVAGATVMGDGRVALILELMKLGALARAHRQPHQTSTWSMQESLPC